MINGASAFGAGADTVYSCNLPKATVRPCAFPAASGEMVLEGSACRHDGRLATHGECHDI
jgi:hypothetical protein